MKRNTSIQLKAAFLLVIFGLNTIVGFACSVGVDMGFNSKHHHDEEATEAVVHIHNDGKRHVHNEKKENHNHDKSHHSDELSGNHKSGEEGNCCNDKVRNFEQLDKSVPQVINVIHPVFFTAFLSSFYSISLLHPSDVVIDVRHFVRSYHPPISDIRIAIQSFQI